MDAKASGLRMGWRLADASYATRGVRYQLLAPTIVHDPTRRRCPDPGWIVLGLIGANDFIQLLTARTQGEAP